MENNHTQNKNNFWPFAAKPLTKKEEEEFVANAEKEAERLFGETEKDQQKNDPLPQRADFS